MIKKFLLVAAALAGVALTRNTFAYSPNDSAAPAPRVIPSSVVNPTGLPRNFVGAVIDVEFSLDKKGQPCNINVLRVDNRELEQQLLKAFRQWRFEPGTNDPAANAKRFILPIQINLET